MRKLKQLITILAIIYSYETLAQETSEVELTRIDSVKLLLSDLPDNQEKVILLNEYARINIYNVNFKVGFDALHEARVLARKIEFKGGEILYNLNLAAFLVRGGAYQFYLQNARTLSVLYELPGYYDEPVEPEGYMLLAEAGMPDNSIEAIEYLKERDEYETLLAVYAPLISYYFQEELFDDYHKTINEAINIAKEIKSINRLIDLTGFKVFAASQGFIDEDVKTIQQDIIEFITAIDKKNIGALYYQLGSMEQFGNNDYGAAAEYYLQSIPYIEESNNEIWLMGVFDNLALLYIELGLFNQQVKYLQEAISLRKKLNDQDGLVRNYIDMMWAMFQLKNYSNARIYLDSVKNATSDLYVLELEPIESSLEAQILMDLEDYENAIPLLLQGYDQYVETENIWNTPHEAIHIVDCYLKLEEYSNALKFAKIAESWLERFPERERLASEVYSRNATVYRELGQETLAYQNLVKYHDLIEATDIYDNSRALLNTEIRNIMDQSNSQIVALEQEQFVQAQENKVQRMFIFAAVGALLSILVIVIILYRNNKEKQKANALLEEQKSTIEGALTKLKSTQSQLIQSEKMASLGELTAGIAHEIQNPLNFVNNFSEVSVELTTELREEIQSGDFTKADETSLDLKTNLEKIAHHGNRASDIVRSMLEHSQQAEGKKEQIDINKLADEYIRLSYHGLRAKDKSFNAEIDVDLDETLPMIEGVSQDVGRVLLNLINNAFYAVRIRSQSGESGESTESDYKPKVVVSTKNLDSSIQIHIIDNGMGIKEEVKDKVFQPFFTTKPTGEGTGLGLSLSYDIIKSHGGLISIESKESQGSDFCVELPKS